MTISSIGRLGRRPLAIRHGRRDDTWQPIRVRTRVHLHIAPWFSVRRASRYERPSALARSLRQRSSVSGSLLLLLARAGPGLSEHLARLRASFLACTTAEPHPGSAGETAVGLDGGTSPLSPLRVASLTSTFLLGSKVVIRRMAWQFQRNLHQSISLFEAFAGAESTGAHVHNEGTACCSVKTQR